MYCGLPSIVASYAGAWIEIDDILKIIEMVEVASYAGAWIEIFAELRNFNKWFMSHPTRVRGLKSPIGDHDCKCAHVASYAGAWIEISGMIHSYSGRSVPSCADA